MSYTPQAGDVWSNPKGVVWRIASTPGIMLRADLLANAGQENERWIEGIAKYIPSRMEKHFAKNGWTLVSRKEVQDGK